MLTQQASRDGSVGVVLDGGAFAGGAIGPDLQRLVASVEPVVVIGIDIPVGTTTAGVRQADLGARAFIKPRGSSVFPAPRYEVWEAADYASANAWLGENAHPKLSQQAWALVRVPGGGLSRRRCCPLR